MNEGQDGTGRCGEPDNPGEDETIGCKGHSPAGHSEEHQNHKACPFESTSCPRVDVRLTAAIRTTPSFVETQWQNRNPENMPRVETANLNRAARLCA